MDTTWPRPSCLYLARQTAKAVLKAACVAGVVMASAPAWASHELIWVLDFNNNILSFYSDSPGIIRESHPITGLSANEALRGMDYWVGTLYALGDAGHLYQVDPSAGTATQIGSLGVILNGAWFGVDNGPPGLQVVSELGQSLLIQRTTGIATVMPGVPGELTGLAYNPATGSWYAADSLQNTLVSLNPATGAAATIGPMGIDLSRANGMDFSAGTGILYLASPAASSDPQANLYSVNHATGAVTLIGLIGPPGANILVRGLSVCPDSNDTCDGAIALSNAVSCVMDTSSATSSGDPLPPCSTQFGKGVWFSYTPPANALVTVSTAGSSSDTVIQVFTGSCGSLKRVAYGCNDDNGPAQSGTSASVVFSALANTKYYILAGGYAGLSGTLQISATAGLVNDPCSGALPLMYGVPFTMDTSAASSAGDPAASCSAYLSNAVWFRFASPVTAPVLVSTCGSTYDTVLQVFSGSCGSLAPVVCNDDYGPGCPASRQASLSFNATAATTYYMLAGGYFGATGTLTVVAGNPPTLTATLQSGQVQLSWPPYYWPGYVLQRATNAPGPLPIAGWVDQLPDYPPAYWGTSNAAAFFRLATP
jgi:hypothetical protein